MNIDRPAWMADGACTGLDPATRNRLFFPDRTQPLDQVRIMCAFCPVKTPCLEYAVVENVRGVWGGTSERQRRAIRRERGLMVRGRRVAECGTNAGYASHGRDGEEACDECKAAHAVYTARWSKRKTLAVVQ